MEATTKRFRINMRLEEKLISLLVAGLLLYVFVPYMFELSKVTGIGFIVACSLALYKGAVFRDPRIIGFIAVGYILTNLAISQILPMVYEDLIQESFLTALIILIVFLSVYMRGRELKSY
jgi:hypothetical protein